MDILEKELCKTKIFRLQVLIYRLYFEVLKIYNLPTEALEVMDQQVLQQYESAINTITVTVDAAVQNLIEITEAFNTPKATH